MIYTLLAPIQTALEEISWVDNYRGLVRTYRKRTKEGVQRVAVVCNASFDDCKSDSSLKEHIVTPDDGYKSLIIIENPRGYSIGSLFDNKPTDIIAEINIKVWLNLNKIGVSNCSSIDNAISEVTSALKGISQAQGSLTLYRITNLQITPRDTNIFSNYDFGEKWSLWPFEYFTIQCNVSCRARPDCLEFITEGSEIEC